MAVRTSTWPTTPVATFCTSTAAAADWKRPRRSVASRVFATLFVVGLTLSVGGQRYFHDQYNAYVNVDVSMFASNLMDSVFNQLFADIRTYLIAKIPPLVVSVALLFVARRVIRPRRRGAIGGKIL